MIYDLSFDYVAVIIMVFLLMVYRGKRKASLPVYQVHYQLSVTILFTAIFDILSVWIMRRPDEFSIESIYLINMAYLLLQNFILVIYMKYELYCASVDIRKNKAWKVIVYTPYWIAATLIITTHYTKWIFTVSEEGVYAHAPGFLFLYLLMAYYGILCAFVIIRYRNSMDKEKFFYLFAIYGVVVSVQLLQFLLPSVLLVPFACALAMIMIVYDVQSPDEIFDGTNAMYRKYFIQGMAADYSTGQTGRLLFLKLHDYDILRESFGEEELNHLLRGMCGYLQSLHPDSLIFRIDEHTYAYKIQEISEQEMYALVGMIEERFKESWKSGAMDVVLPVNFALIAYPEDVKDYNEFTSFMTVLSRSEMDSNEVMTMKDFAGDDENMEILEAVKNAVEKDLFQVYYQPIYSVEEKRIIAAEALVRLFDEKLGFISPEKFIPLAEKEGYILKIGRFVFQEVCRFYSENSLQEKGIDYIEVNLSAIQCMQYQMAEEFIGIMKENNIKAKQVNFEITETSAMITNRAVALNISRFENHGIALSLDDYGTGYSNLSYLYHMPFHFIKIDKSILWSSEKNDKADITLQNIFRMAKKLQLKIVMEGVETEAQIRKLLTMGCDYFQGYYFSKPVCGKDFLDYVQNFELPDVCKPELKQEKEREEG